MVSGQCTSLLFIGLAMILALLPRLSAYAGESSATGSAASDALLADAPPLPLRGPIQSAPLRGHESAETLTLVRAFNVALANNPRTEAARAQLGIAKSNLVQANVLPNPGVFIDNQYKFTYKLGASMTIEPPWRLIFRRAAAKSFITQTDLEIARTLWLFRADVRRTYVEAVVAQEMAEVRRQLLDLLNRLWTVAKERFEKGDVAKLDVHRAELAVIQAQIQVEQADIVVKQTAEQLAIVLAKNGLDSSKLSSVKTDLLTDASKLPSQAELLTIARANRLELKIVEQQKKVNRANLLVARGNILPAPRFNVGGMREDIINGPLNRKTAFFQAVIDLPILDRQQGVIAKLKATDTQLASEFLSQDNIINAQVFLAHRRVQTQLVKIETFRRRALALSNTISTAADLSYRIGQTDINSAIVAQQENVVIRTQYLDALLAYELAINELEQAIGTPLQ